MKYNRKEHYVTVTEKMMCINTKEYEVVMCLKPEMNQDQNWAWHGGLEA